MVIDLFVPCFIDQFHPETAFNAIKVLERCGLTVNYNPDQTDCGMEEYNAGYWEQAKVLGEKFLSDFSGDNPIVGLSTACVAYIQNNFQSIFYNSGSHLQYKKVETNIYEFTDFLVNGMGKTDFGSRFEAKATYHDSCHALRKYKYPLINEPRMLLKNVEGLELIEMKDSDECCGFGGLFSLKYSPISSALAELKVRNAIDAGVTHIISADWSCLINLDAYIKRHDLPLHTLHIADVLSSSI